jgi:hypothetical protein
MLARLLPLGALGLAISSGCSERAPAVSGDLPGARFDGGPRPIESRDAAAHGDDAPDGAAAVGIKVGDLFPPLVFDGYETAGAPWSTLRIADLEDPDGARGIRAIVLVVAAEWCGTCRQEVGWLRDAYRTKYAGEGARFLTVLVQDRNGLPATKRVADDWQSTFAIPYGVAIDPRLTTVPKNEGRLSLPYTYVVDPRTMKIEQIVQGAIAGGSVPGLDPLLERNR